jgi:hypothetical protein
MWYSVRPQRTVLAVARTVTTAIALLDGLPDLLGDHRVETLFTVMPRQRDANFERGIERLLHDAQVRLIPWNEAVARRFDLVVTASYEGYLTELSGPLFMLRHGAAIGKNISLPADGRLPVTSDGLGSTTMVLSHSEQAAHYLVDDERVRLLVAGDPVLDRLRASLPGRDRYRDALEIPNGIRLVAMTSTWGEHSLIAVRPDLPARLLAELPADEFCVAAILHPSVWFGHSGWQIRTWLRSAIDAGLVLAAPRGAWRGLLVAADAVVGDHGSVTLHAAALGKPVCLGTCESGELIAGAPSAQLEDAMPFLDASAALRPQIQSLIAEHDPDRYREIIERAFEFPGASHAILRRAMYELLGLDEPAQPPRVLAVDLPEVIREHVTAYRVSGLFDAKNSLVLSRSPAVLDNERLPPLPPPSLMSHLAVEEDERDLRLLQNAAVIVRRRADPDGVWSAGILNAYPGTRLAATVQDDACVSVLFQSGEVLAVTIVSGSSPALDPMLLASAVYAFEVSGQLADNTEQRLTVKVGESVFSLRLACGTHD